MTHLMEKFDKKGDTTYNIYVNLYSTAVAYNINSNWSQI